MDLNLDPFVALDVEIASRSPLMVCAIGAARFESGRETAHDQSLVRFTGRVRYAHIHGLARTELRDAPLWPTVWTRIMTVLGDVRTVIAYRAAFDRAAVMTMCARHALPMPRVRFVCAARLYEAGGGRSAELASVLRTLNVPFPGQPHEPLSDARAAAALVLSLRRREEGVAIQLSKNPLPGDPARPR